MAIIRLTNWDDGTGEFPVLDTDRDDRIYAYAGDDVIQAGLGDDRVYGGEGDDTIRDTAGSNRLYGGAGNDHLTGGGARQLLDGGTGDDRLFSGAGRDTLFGGEGNDELGSGAGRDRLFGNGGDDYLFADLGNDLLDGGAGRDVLQGYLGNDRLTGGADADTFIFSLGTAFEPGRNRDLVTDFADGEDTLFFFADLGAPVIFEQDWFDSNGDGTVDGNDLHVDLRRVTLDGETATSLVLDYGREFGFDDQTVTLFGITQLDGYDVVV